LDNIISGGKSNTIFEEASCGVITTVGVKNFQSGRKSTISGENNNSAKAKGCVWLLEDKALVRILVVESLVLKRLVLAMMHKDRTWFC